MVREAKRQVKRCEQPSKSDDDEDDLRLLENELQNEIHRARQNRTGKTSRHDGQKLKRRKTGCVVEQAAALCDGEINNCRGKSRRWYNQ